MGKIWDKPYYARRQETDDLAEKYGVSRDDFIETDIDGERGMTNDSNKAYEEAISKAASKDYHTQRSIEAAQLAGYEGADDLGKGISNLKEASDAYDFMQNIHKDELGNTGKFSSANDFGNVTNFLVNNDRDTFTNKMENKFQDYIEQNKKEGTAADDVEQQSKEITFSPELQAAHSRTAAHTENQQKNQNNPYNFDPDKLLESTPSRGESYKAGDGPEQRDTAAQNFHDKFKLDLMRDIRKNKIEL